MAAEGIIFRNRLGRTIKMIRQAKSLTQADLARKVRTSRAAVSSLERGDKAPTILTLERVCSGLQVPSAVVLRFAEIDWREALNERQG